MRRFAVSAWGLGLVVGMGHAGSANADVVLDWNSVAIRTTHAEALGANPQSRALAIVHLAVHDAVSAVSPRYAPFHAKPDVVAPASAEAAAAAAAYNALLALVPAQKAVLDEALLLSLQAVADSPAKTHGLDVGLAAATDLLAARQNDGAAGIEIWPSGAAPGAWREVPPGNKAVEPWWRKVKPFALPKPEQFRSPAPPALESAAYASALAQVKSLGRNDSALRTPAQTAIALFWNTSPVTLANAAARQVSAARNLDLVEEARLFALLNAALADAQVAAADGEFTYNLWRPVSAIAEASSSNDVDASDDGSAAVNPDATFTPLLTGNTAPDYPSGAATTVAAGLGLLELYFGDDVSFTLASEGYPDQARAFASFSQASGESARSHYYGGANFAFSTVAGEGLGANVARYTYLNLLPPASASDAGIEAGELDAPPGDGDVGDESPDAAINEGGRDGGKADAAAEASAVPLIPDDFDSGCSVAAPGLHATRGRSATMLATLAIVAGWRRRRRPRAEGRARSRLHQPNTPRVP